MYIDVIENLKMKKGFNPIEAYNILMNY